MIEARQYGRLFILIIEFIDWRMRNKIIKTVYFGNFQRKHISQALIKPHTIKDFLKHIEKLEYTTFFTPQNFMAQRQWMANSYQLVVSSFSALHNLDFYYLFRACEILRFHRSSFYDLAEKYCNCSLLTLHDLTKIYSSSVLLKHPNNQKFLKQVREEIIKKYIGLSLQELKREPKLFYFVSSVILDKSVEVGEKNEILKRLDLTLEKIGGDPDFFKTNGLYYRSFLDHIRLYKLNINKKCLDTVTKFSKTPKKREIQSSIFEKLVKRALEEIGFKYNSNVDIGGNEVDLIITGVYKRKYCPLSNVKLDQDLSNINSIKEEEVKLLANSVDIDHIIDYKSLEGQVVLSLNGPMHYIDSDILPISTITRYQEFNYEKLPLYSIRKYNMLDYKQWEKANTFQSIGHKLLIQKIMNPIVIN